MYVVQPWSLSAAQIASVLVRSQTIDLSPGPGGSRITPIDLRDQFGDDRTAIVVLYPSAQLVGHRDPPIVGTRYHVPLIVNAGCWVFHGGTWQQLEIGRAYQMDPTEDHGAVNWGAERRLHLLIDRKE